MPLRVAIVHYHLRPGGVTRVIENAVASLDGHGVEAAVLSGAPYARSFLERARAVEGLDYRAEHSGNSPRELADALDAEARSALGGDPDVWHFHNHALGKNSALPGAIERLLGRGAKALFQLHDFAEDGRPANYRVTKRGGGNLYPQAPQCHYAVLNARDAAFLRSAGVSRERLHALPNPVPVSDLRDAKPVVLPGVDRIYLSPVRGIRRKNLGELVLWSALGGAGDYFATALAPERSETHSRWERFAGELGLPVGFGVAQAGEGVFREWVSGAHALVTTSVAEGFGLAFLEPWAFGKPLVGRDLPEITRDFGIDLSALYDRLDVPLELVGENALRQRLRTALEAYYAGYGRTLPADGAERCFGSVVRDGLVDFGALDEPLQERVVRRIADSGELRRVVRPSRLPVERASDAVAGNRERVRAEFGLAAYGDRLASLYRRIAESPVERPEPLDSERVLDRYLEPERFRLLRD